MNNRRKLNSRRREFANPGITANTYAGNLALPFATPALKANTTVSDNLITILDGIHYKAVVPIESIATDAVVAADCAFSDGNSYTLDEAVVTLTSLKVNEKICRGTVYETWHGLGGTSMTTTDYMSQEFINFTLGLAASRAANTNENWIWKGNTAFANGFLSSTGTFDATGYAGSALNGANVAGIAAVTSGNAIAQFNAVYNKGIETVEGIFSSADLGFYCNTKTYALYTQQLAGLGAGSYGYTASGGTAVDNAGQGVNNAGPLGNFQGLNFMGITINVCPGMPDDAIVLSPKSNLVMATNLGTDLNTVQFIPTYLYDGSDNVSINMRFAYGNVVPVPLNAVVGHTH